MTIQTTQFGHRGCRRAGFTAIELMIVVVIAGVLGSLAVPAMRKFIAHTQLSSAANGIKMQLLMARARAVADVNTHCGVYFHSDSLYYRVFIDSTSDGSFTSGSDAWFGEKHKLPRHIGYGAHSDAASDILQFNSCFVFRGDGSAVPLQGQNLRIQLISLGTKAKVINVLPSTGRIKVGEP